MSNDATMSVARIDAPSVTSLLLRELIGWIIVALGIYTFRLSIVDYFNRALTIEGIVTVIMGIVLFRGGLQLVKVSVAARAVHYRSQAVYHDQPPRA